MVRRIAWIIAFVLLLTSRAALADIPANLPPDLTTTSPWGVNLRTGIYDYADTDLSIGTPESGGFELVRQPWTGGGVFDNQRTITTNWHYAIKRRPYQSSAGYYFTIENSSIGTTFFTTTSQTTFTLSSLQTGRGSKLERFASGSNFYFVYTAPDNTRITFAPSATGEGPATLIERPNGITYTFTNSTSGRRILSNTGYMLMLEFDASGRTKKACVLNTATVAAPTGFVCPAGVQASSYTYAANNTLATATDPVNAVTTYSNTFSSLGTPYSESITRPGQSQAAVSIQYDNETYCGTKLGAKTQTLGDGHVISYNWNMVGAGECIGGVAPVMLGWTDNPSVTPAANTSLGWTFTQAQSTFTPSLTPTPTSISDPLSRVSTITYNSAYTQVAQTKTPAGLKVDYTYTLDNLTGRAQTPIPALGGSVLNTSWTYDCTYQVYCAKPASRTDARGNVTDYTYSSVHGGLLTETLPAATTGGIRPKTTNTYAQYTATYNGGSGTVWLLQSTSTCISQASCAGTSDEVKTTYTYNTTLNLLPATRTETSGTLTRTVSWTYDAIGNKLSEDGPLSGTADTTYWRYDARRRVVGVISPDPDGAGALQYPAVRNTYDSSGRLIRVESGQISSVPPATTAPSAWTGFTVLRKVETAYDVLDRKTAERSYGSDAANFALTQYSYDIYGRADCTTVRMNSSNFASPPSACTQGTGTADRIERNSYDLAGQLVQVRRAYGTTLEQVYATYSYTLDSLTEFQIDATGNRAKYEYDGHDRRLKWLFPSTTKPTAYNPATQSTALSTAGALNTGDYEQYGYDNNSNRTSLRLRDASTTAYTFDNLDRVSSRTPAGEPVVNYGYDLRGLLTSEQRPSDGINIISTYDGLGRLTSEAQAYSTITYQYDLADRRTRMTFSDGNYIGYDYDLANRVSVIRENGATSGVGVLASYTYNAQGLRSSVAFGNTASRVYAWDTTSRLAGIRIELTGTTNDLVIGAVSGVGTAIAYNPASQITSLTRSNDLYAWTGHTNIDQAYVPNGLDQYTTVAGSALSYDQRGNLTSWGTSTYTYSKLNELKTAPNATLTYDPRGRLVQYTANSVTTRFAYAGPDLVFEANGLNTIKRRFVPGPDIDEPVVWYEGNTLTADRRWLQADERGSIVSVSDGSGNSLAINRYDEYGRPQSTNQGRYGYTGQTWYPEIALYNYKARWYSPVLGRFMQTDPIGYDDQINLYAYVANDPVNGTDPTGTTCTKAENTITCVVKIKGSGENGAITKQDRADAQRLANNYLKAAIRADAGARAGQVVTVKPMQGSGLKPFTVPASEIRNNLFNRTYTYDRNARGGDAGMTTGSNGAMTAGSWIYRGAADQTNRWQQEAFIHEAIHGSYSEARGMPGYVTRLGIQPWSDRHQEPYNDAADQILGR